MDEVTGFSLYMFGRLALSLDKKNACKQEIHRDLVKPLLSIVLLLYGIGAQFQHDLIIAKLL